MPYYKVCPNCGCHLDPGEICDCRKQDEEPESPAPVAPLALVGGNWWKQPQLPTYSRSGPIPGEPV